MALDDGRNVRFNNYVGSDIRQENSVADARQFAFFGDFGDADDALEAGLDAPPPEDARRPDRYKANAHRGVDGLELLQMEEEQRASQAVSSGRPSFSGVEHTQLQHYRNDFLNVQKGNGNMGQYAADALHGLSLAPESAGNLSAAAMFAPSPSRGALPSQSVAMTSQLYGHIGSDHMSSWGPAPPAHPPGRPSHPEHSLRSSLGNSNAIPAVPPGLALFEQQQQRAPQRPPGFQQGAAGMGNLMSLRLQRTHATASQGLPDQHPWHWDARQRASPPPPTPGHGLNCSHYSAAQQPQHTAAPSRKAISLDLPSGSSGPHLPYHQQHLGAPAPLGNELHGSSHAPVLGSPFDSGRPEQDQAAAALAPPPPPPQRTTYLASPSPLRPPGRSRGTPSAPLPLSVQRGGQQQQQQLPTVPSDQSSFPPLGAPPSQQRNRAPQGAGRSSAAMSQTGLLPGHAPATHVPRMHGIPGLERWVRDWTAMSAREVDELLAFNMRNTHSGELYADDYAYQAYLHKVFNGVNRLSFRPQKVYALASHERPEASDATHARVEGLGKFVYASLRTPRQLLAVDGGGGRARAARKGERGGSEPRSSTQAGVNSAAVAAVQRECGSGDANAETMLRSAVRAATTAEAALERADSHDADAAAVEGVEDALPGAAGTAARATVPSLQTDRRVAARKVLEDCSCLLLDVDDIDRIVASERLAADTPPPLPPHHGSRSAGGVQPPPPPSPPPPPQQQQRESAPYLVERRSLLMSSISVCLRISPPPAGDAGTGAALASSDAVFEFLCNYTRGRALVAQVLHRLAAPARGGGCSAPADGLHMLLAVLRNIRLLFGEHHQPLPLPSVEESEALRKLRTSSTVAAAAAGALSRLVRRADVLECFAAFAAADVVTDTAVDAAEPNRNALLPLLTLHSDYRPDPSLPWLQAVLAALLAAARRLDLASAAEHAAAFAPLFDAIFARLMTHIRFLVGVLSVSGGEPAVVQSVQLLAAPSLLSEVLPFCRPDQEALLVVTLQEVARAGNAG